MKYLLWIPIIGLFLTDRPTKYLGLIGTQYCVVWHILWMVVIIYGLGFWFLTSL